MLMILAKDVGNRGVRPCFIRLLEGVKRVPEAGVEPARSCERRILSPLRLPVSPPRHGDEI